MIEIPPLILVGRTGEVAKSAIDGFHRVLAD